MDTIDIITTKAKNKNPPLAMINSKRGIPINEIKSLSRKKFFI